MSRISAKGGQAEPPEPNNQFSKTPFHWRFLNFWKLFLRNWIAPRLDSKWLMLSNCYNDSKSINLLTMKQYWSKIVSRIHDIVKDLDGTHYSDLVIHSKALITMLVSLALKKHGASFEFRSDRRTTYEEKLEYLLDNQWISEEVYDNCINTLSLRNPIEHIYTYPNEFFAKGAAKAAVGMYMSLQSTLDLPHIPKSERLIEEFGIGVPFVLSCSINKFEITFDQVKGVLKRYPGSYQVLANFPTTLFRGELMPGLRLDEKVQYSQALLAELRALDGVGKVEYAGCEIIPVNQPHINEYLKDQYPSLGTP